MRPCPECGSSDRHEDQDRYALLKLGEGTKLAGELTAERIRVDGLMCSATTCRNCGHVALFTQPE